VSHFAVIVIGDDVEAALRPFQENNMGDCPPEYLKFHDETDEVRSSWDAEDEATRAKYAGNIAAYAAEHYGYRAREIVDGVERFGYLENPNKKWDWWVVGGRFSGRFPTAAGAVDSALKSEIDWTPRRDEHEARARDRFARWKQALDAHPEAARPLTWPEVLEKHGVENVDSARAEYNAQPQIATWKGIAEAHDWQETRCDPVRDLGFDIDALVARERRRAPVPFAFLHAGEWHEKGRMGWFAMVSNEKDVDGWCAEWERVWDALPPDARLTCVDCHI
jgi:hypothetical protein